MFASPVMAPLLPKLRGQFAEFLNHSSPDRLSIFYLTTCVGFGYGPYTHIARGFSRQHRITDFTTMATHHVSGTQQADLPTCHPTRLHQAIHYLAQLPSCVTPSLGYYQIRSRASTTTTSKKAAAASGQLVSLIHHGRAYTGTGISTRYPSTTPVGLALGPDSPWED